jgi:hypothetical protein
VKSENVLGKKSVILVKNYLENEDIESWTVETYYNDLD